MHSLTDGFALARLLAVCTLFGWALLAVFRAPLSFLWKPAVIATELGHVLAVVAILLALPGWTEVRGQLETGLAIVSALLLLSPLARSILVARELPAQLAEAFGENEPRALAEAPARRAPIVMRDLVFVSSPDVRVTNHTFREHQGTTLSLDLYRRDGAPPPLPIVMVIHGGSWSRGDKEELPAINRYLAARGYAVAVIDYRLAPRHIFPAAQQDTLAAIDFLQKHAAELGLDASRVVLLGRSAGGHLALLTAYTARNPAVRGVVAYYPPSDMNWSHENPANPLVYDSRSSLEAFLGGSPEERPESYVAASPYRFVHADAPATLLIHGTRDELVRARQTRRLARRLAETGVPHLSIEMPWATHGLDAVLAGPGGQISTYAVERFIASLTR